VLDPTDCFLGCFATSGQSGCRRHGPAGGVSRSCYSRDTNRKLRDVTQDLIETRKLFRKQ